MLRTQELDADHDEARAHGGEKATRLLHAICNRQRGDGSRDDVRPAITGVWPPPAMNVSPSTQAGQTGPPEPRADVLNWPLDPPPQKYPRAPRS